MTWNAKSTLIRVALAAAALGVLSGLAVATGPAALTLFQAGEPIRATELNRNFENLNTAIGKTNSDVTTLSGRATTLEGIADCPTGYVNITLSDSFFKNSVHANNPQARLCRRGADEMVRVGPIWVDRYEITVVDESKFAAGLFNGFGTNYGAALNDYGAGFPASGNWTTPLYACSIGSQIPSGYATYYQASQLCALAGKRLISNSEWQMAAAGTPDPGNHLGADGSCSTATTNSVPRTTGAGTKCNSKWGAQDMIGNLEEVTSDLVTFQHPALSGTEGQYAPFAGLDTPFGDKLDLMYVSPAAPLGQYTVNWRGGGLTECRPASMQPESTTHQHFKNERWESAVRETRTHKRFSPKVALSKWDQAHRNGLLRQLYSRPVVRQRAVPASSTFSTFSNRGECS